MSDLGRDPTAAQAAMWKATCDSLQMQLADRTEAMTRTEEDKRALDEKVAKIKADFEEEQKTAFEITRDMTRQRVPGVD